MTDAQLQCFLERLRLYHGADRIVLTFLWEDGQSIIHTAEATSE